MKPVSMLYEHELAHSVTGCRAEVGVKVATVQAEKDLKGPERWPPGSGAQRYGLGGMVFVRVIDWYTSLP
jgi:hypothetical protein